MVIGVKPATEKKMVWPAEVSEIVQGGLGRQLS